MRRAPEPPISPGDRELVDAGGDHPGRCGLGIQSGGPRLHKDDHLSALQSGVRLHSYTIGEILGAGGFGITYKAREDITNRDVAIKEYLPTAFAVRDRDGATVRPLSEGAARDFEWGLERFREEAKLLIGFRHPNIVPVLAYFEANGTGYLVMAFQEGTSLSEMLRATLTLSEAQVLEFAIPLLDGVEEVHKHNFLHRDIKPENIFILGDGSPVLLDFGAARQALGEHSKGLTTLLTEGYAPFEQYAGSGNQGPWSDIYAFAAVMFRCLTGKPPSEAPRRAIAKLRGMPDPMAADFAALRTRISSDFAFAIEAALRVVEQERPQSIAAFRELIVSPAPRATRPAPPVAAPTPSAPTLIPDAAQPEAVRHPPPWYVPERKAPRRTVRYAAFGAVALAAVSGAAYVGDQRNWLPDAFRRAGPENSATAPAPPPARKAAEDAKPPTEEARRPADDEAQRVAEERRRSDERELDERRSKGLADYQRLQLDQLDAERRRVAPVRKSDDSSTAPDSGNATWSDERARSDAERKRIDEEQARRDRGVTRPAPRVTQDQRRDPDRSLEEPPDYRRETSPGAPPSMRRSPDSRFPPGLPPGRNAGPRGWSDGYDDY